MTDDEILKLAKKLKLPRIMWNTIDFRKFLIRVYVAGQGSGAAMDASYAHVPPKPAGAALVSYRHVGKIAPRALPQEE